mmetsp:Transcript_17968/g.41938  ORF Transcript_17968/g.41938 Transcript_17968/m.41938 type:complete len:280 (+) Transcript_17968:64-903(+)
MATTEEAAHNDECVSLTVAAAEAENSAIELDRKGKFKEAIAKYEECIQGLSAAISASGTGHQEDTSSLEEHRKQVLGRTSYLRGFKGDPSEVSPIEEYITPIQLNMKADEKGGHNPLKKIAAVAGLGAAAGFIVLGGILGGAFAVAAGGGAAAYAATRQDGIGNAARKAGEVTLDGVDKAADLNREHKITEKLAEAGRNAMDRAKEMNEKYKITEKAKAGMDAAVTKVQEVEAKHHVTDKVAAGFASGVEKISDALSKSNSKGDVDVEKTPKASSTTDT